jgi:hypothetical protein
VTCTNKVAVTALLEVAERKVVRQSDLVVHPVVESGP